MILTIENLHCERAGRTVFANLCTQVEPGGALVLAGPNGAGKSSLLRILAGLIRPATGDARLGGVSVVRDRAEFQANVLFAGHLDGLKPAFTARETLTFWARLYEADEQGVDGALDAMGLLALGDHPVRILSAGQRRRLGLARLALIDRPLWLLDEPTVSLDADSAERVAALARQRCGSGGIVVAATHIDFDLPDPVTLDPSAFAVERTAAEPDDPVLTGEAW